jgi:hypothetical protein
VLLAVSLALAGPLATGCSNQDPDQPAVGSLSAKHELRPMPDVAKKPLSPRRR